MTDKTRYQKIKEYLDSLPPENRRLCPAKGPCACNGCVGSSHLTIRQHHIDLYNKGELK